MTRGRGRRLAPSADDGAVLVLVLILITTVAIVLGAILGTIDTSLRSTIYSRDVSANTYDGDAAGQIAVNTLRKSTWDNATGSNCFGASATLPLNNFYPTSYLSGTGASSAYISCAGETGTGAQGSPVAISAANKPGYAVLTLGTGGETGQTYGQSNKQVTIHGGVLSNSTIDSSKAALTITGGASVSAVGVCTGSITPACTHTAAVADPAYPAPTTPPVLTTPAACTKNKIAVFSPGLYTNADTFNNCAASWLYFKPGQYYFDFQGGGTHIWSVTNTVVGGTLTGAQGDTPPGVPGACVSPLASSTAVGVQFAFGGDSQVQFAKGAAWEICASYSSTQIPTAAYGLKAALGSGANTAHAQSGCVILAGGCDLFSVPSNGSKPDFYFQGFAYAPRASANLQVNNTSAQHFNFGVVFRALALSTTGSAGTLPIISLPDNSPGFGTADTIADLTVHICPAASTCSASGKVKLRARVRINDPTGTPVAGARQVTVLSWTLLP